MKLLKLLRQAEWHLGCCFACGADCSERHMQDCELKAAIDEFEAQEKEAAKAALGVMRKSFAAR